MKNLDREIPPREFAQTKNLVDETWTTDFFRLRGWQSKTKAQAGLHKQLVPEIGRQLEETRLQNKLAWEERPKVANSLATDKTLKAGKEFQKYIAALGEYEKLGPPEKRPVRPVRPEGIKPSEKNGDFADWLQKETEWAKADEIWRKQDQARGKVIGALRSACKGYIDHFTKDHSSGQQKEDQNLRKFNQCTATLTELDKLAEAGRKETVLTRMLGLPWDSEMQMLASTMKAELDFSTLDIPSQEEVGNDDKLKEEMEEEPYDAPKLPMTNQAELLGSPGVNNSFWVNKKGDTEGKKVKSFIFKPMEEKSNNDIPPFGQAAREVLAGRLTDVLNGMLDIDFGMPETQLITVAKERFPKPPSRKRGFHPPTDSDVVGSLQQFAPTNGQVNELPRDSRKKVPAKRCQELSLLDTIMGNTDRHAGNFLVKTGEETNDLVPIDHGLSFPENANFLGQLGQPQNCLILFPGAHEPFSKEMIEKIGKLDPKLLKQTLTGETQTIGSVHPGTQGLVGKSAMDGLEQRTMFVKLACSRLTPAAMQTALASNSPSLFPDPPLDIAAFEDLANKVIAEAEATQDMLQTYYQAPEEDRLLVEQWAQSNGWDKETTKHNKGLLMALFAAGNACPVRENPPDGTDPVDEAVKQAMLTVFPRARVPQDIPLWQSLTEALGKTDPTGVMQELRPLMCRLGVWAKEQDKILGGKRSGKPELSDCLRMVQRGQILAQAVAQGKEALAEGVQAKMLQPKYDWVITILDYMESSAKTGLAESAKQYYQERNLEALNKVAKQAIDGLLDEWATKLNPCRERLVQVRESLRKEEAQTNVNTTPENLKQATGWLKEVESLLELRKFKEASNAYERFLLEYRNLL